MNAATEPRVTLKGAVIAAIVEGNPVERFHSLVGVAGPGLTLAERVRILALELATKQGYTLDEAERLAPPAFKEANPNV